MIYLFNDVKELTGTVRNNHILNLLYEREKNGIYSVSAEIPVTYNDQGTVYNYNKKIQKSDFLGHYDREGRFQLHKIAAVDIENGSIFVKGIHIFFDEAKAGAIIQDRRFINREIIDGARVAFESIGWSVADFDVSVGKTYNFYNVTPLEARQILVETFGFEFDYWLDFDGKKVTNRHVAVKEKIGEKTSKRYTYGHNVLNIRAEQDYSEIYTAVIGRGKGEEIEETGGYGRRIEYTDVVWTTPSKPLNKPAGTRVLEDPTATQLFGYKENGVVKPRIKVEVFSDIESPTELIQASYEWLMDNNVPKAVFSLKVADGDGLNLGDEVYVIYRDIDLIKSARVEKVIDDLVSGNRDVEFGDTAYFDTDRRLSGLRADLKQYRSDQGGLIYALKKEFDRRFSEQVEAFKAEFEQAKIDIFAEIEVDRENMQNLLDNKSAEWTENFNQSVAESKEYAEQQAQEKADAVRTDLETVTSGHQQMLDNLESNVMNIDGFLGDSRSVTLDERFRDITMNFEERIRNIDSTHYNMLRGSSLDNPDLYTLQNTVQLVTSEVDNFARLGLGSSNIPFISLTERFQIVAGEQYHLVFSYRTEVVPEADYLELRGSDLSQRLYVHEELPPEEFELKTDGLWNKKVISFTAPITQSVQLYIGTNFGVGNTQRGILDLKKPYLTTTNNREWLPHPDDEVQNVSEIVRRVTLLEDGQNELITRTEFDFETESIIQDVKRVESTVEGSQTVLQRLEDWEATNGAAISETVYGFEQKVWLNDVANIGANLIPQSSRAWEDGSLWLASGLEAPVNTGIRLIDNIEVLPNETYTIADKSIYVSAINNIYVFEYSINGTFQRYTMVSRGQETSFTTHRLTTNIRIFMSAITGGNVLTSFMESADNRIKVKLERGSVATPMLNAISRIEQLANSVSIQVQELDGDFLSQSDIQVHPGYVQLGSQRLGDSQFASIFRVSPNSIDAITERMTLNGDLYVDGDITALAVDAIEGNFARLFANQLTANVITSDHIQVGTALVDKMFATSARIDELITKTHFVNNIKAMSIEAVEGQFSTLFTRYLSANYIDADYIVGKNAWFETQYVKTSNISKLTSQTAFIRDVQAIEVTANQLNIQTLHSKLRGVEGGLTIYGPDGRVLINNSILKASFDVQLRPSYGSNDVSFNGLNYQTKSPNWQTFEYFYTEYKGSKLLVSWAYSLADGSPSGVELAEFRVRGFGSNNPITTRESNRWAEKGKTGYNNQIIELGVPDYSTIQAYLEFRRSPSQQHTENKINVRVLRVSMID